jgi:NNP family nitrate/nitrite transporter-like MFS transporter
MKLSELKTAGHWPTLVAAFLYFDVSFMIWTLLGTLGVQIGESLGLSPQQKGLMVAVPILAAALLRSDPGALTSRRCHQILVTLAAWARTPLLTRR